MSRTPRRRTPLDERPQDRLDIGNRWLALSEKVEAIYRSTFIAKVETDHHQMLRHMGDQHNRLRIEYHLLSTLTGMKLCPACKGEKAVTVYGELTVEAHPCEVCEQKGVVTR